MNRTSSVQEVLKKLSSVNKKERKPRKVSEPEICSASAEFVINNKVNISDCSSEYLASHSIPGDYSVRIDSPTTPGDYLTEMELVVISTADTDAGGSRAKCNRKSDKQVDCFDPDKTESVSTDDNIRISKDNSSCSLTDTKSSKLRNLGGLIVKSTADTDTDGSQVECNKNLDKRVCLNVSNCTESATTEDNSYGLSRSLIETNYNKLRNQLVPSAAIANLKGAI